MKYYISLFQKLKSIYDSQSGQTNEVVLLCPSQRVFTNEELNLLVPQGLIEKELIGESLYKKRDISYQLNSIPLSGSLWDINPSNSLFDRYRDILNGIKPNKLEESLLSLNLETDSLLYIKGKETKEFKAYKKYFNELEKVIETAGLHLATYEELSSDDQKKVWAEKLNIIQNKIKIAFTDLVVKGNKDAIEAVLERISKKTDLENYMQLINLSKSIFDITEKTDTITLAPYHDISFVPYDFMKSDSGWNKLKLTKAELDLEYNEAKLIGANLPQEIVSIDYDEKYIAGIELDYSFVHLKRSWFNTAILESEFLGWNGQKIISDGKTISNDFMLSAYPKTMILIKKLKVNIDSNVTEIQIDNPNQLIQFGPLIMKSQLFVNQATNVKFVKAITNKETLLSTQLNYKLKKADFSAVKVEVPLSTVVKPTEVVQPIIEKNNEALGNSRVFREKSSKPFIMSARTISPSPIEISVRPQLITTIATPINIVVPIKTTKVTIKLINKITKEAVYNCETSIRGIDNNAMSEIDSNFDGDAIISQLPLGSYKVECKKDGYKFFTSNFKIENTNNISLDYILEPDEVTFDTYFLIGMVCETIPKCPKVN